ncbi:MAG: TerD family protein [Thermoguttaceae bacterium]|nr:TerD family protein [Thermoguttaceae bacterium]MBR4105011.1 TerD family protein [Thermoguttaceae bacterium]
MAIKIQKGQNTQLDAGLTQIEVGLGWNPRVGAGEAFDLDASCFMLAANGRIRSDSDVIFYNQQESTCGSVKHSGDDRTGSQSDGGDDESIRVNLPTIPSDVVKLVFVATIYDALKRGQNFGMVDDAYMRVVDGVANEELVRFELTEDACLEQSLIFGELYKRNGAWKFRALGQAFDGDLGALARQYGAAVE